MSLLASRARVRKSKPYPPALIPAPPRPPRIDGPELPAIDSEDASASTGTAAWHHFALTIDATANTGVLYYDGAANQTNTGGITLDPSSLGTNNQNYFGRSQYAADDGLQQIDVEEIQHSFTCPKRRDTPA